MKSNEPVISVKGMSKMYRLGVISRHTLADEVSYLAHKIRGKDPADAIGKGVTRIGSHSEDQVDSENKFWALKNLSFDVKKGEVLGVIGRNGAGKSTLLKILSKITEPTKGYADIDGRVASLLEVGTGFHPELTGRENVYLNGTILGMRKCEVDKKFDEIVEFAELSQFIDTPVKRYSSGMYVRLAFAVAAHLEPEILLVDEVLAVGDLQFQKKCMNKMQNVSESGRTILFVSHNIPAIARLCSSAILLEKGRLVKYGDAADVVAAYTSSALDTASNRVWADVAAPGENGYSLLSVTLKDMEDEPIISCDIEKGAKIVLCFKVAGARSFRTTISLYTQGVCAFVALESREYDYDRPGVYRKELYIPPNLLAEGEYIVGISVFASKGKKLHLCRMQDVIAFQVVDYMRGGSVRGDYAEGLGGLLRPRLDWSTNQVE